MSDYQGDSTVLKLPTIQRDGAEAEIRRIAETDTGQVLLLDHARDRMRERGITDRQVFKVLRHGELVASPRWDTKEERGWKCRFRRITAGEHVNVIAKIVERDNQCVLVVTVY